MSSATGSSAKLDSLENNYFPLTGLANFQKWNFFHYIGSTININSSSFARHHTWQAGLSQMGA